MRPGKQSARRRARALAPGSLVLRCPLAWTSCPARRTWTLYARATVSQLSCLRHPLQGTSRYGRARSPASHVSSWPMTSGGHTTNGRTCCSASSSSAPPPFYIGDGVEQDVVRRFMLLEDGDGRFRGEVAGA